MDEILDHVPEPEEKVKRPVVITIVCVLEFSVLLLFAGYIIGFHYSIEMDGFFAYLVVRTVLGTVLAIGMWRMKKVAAYAFIAVNVLNQVILLQIERWTIQSLVFPMIMVILVLTRIERMR